jgi:hypothetical protein
MPPRVYPTLDAFIRMNGTVDGLALADELGCSYSHLWAIRSGRAEPKLRLAIALVKRCHIPIESLVLTDTQRERKGQP